MRPLQPCLAMLLLHISDIHFRHPVCGTPMDPDRPYRTHLVRDARDRARAWGQVNAILVTGDIAYRGAPPEYEAALTWLSDLASACACPLERVFVVPGNHDVDRSVIVNNVSVRNAQHAIKSAAQGRRERELLEQLQDSDAGRALMAPLAAYNVFAARFNCQVYSPDRLFWQQSLPFDDQGVSLLIYGLTSTLLSGAGGGDDTRESLYLSPLQTVLDPVDRVVNLVMCHHPPDWFIDQDDVEDAIRGRAAIHLFGHKHRQRIARDAGYARFSAGAVNPDRNEPGWEPGYNLIRLSLGETAGRRHVELEAQLLVWQTNPDMFRPRMVSATDSVFRHRLPLHELSALAQHGGPGDSSTEPASPGEVDAPKAVEAPMTDQRTRNLVLRFWTLSSSQRRDIAERLGLIDQGDLQRPEPERYGRALLRAGERGLLEQVAEEVERLERLNAER